MSDVVYALEDFYVVIKEYKYLLPLLYSETHYKDLGLELNPKEDEYYNLFKCGKLAIFTVRDKYSEALVGLCLVIATPYLHCQDKLVASADMLVLLTAYRSYDIVSKWIDFMQEELKKAGIDYFIMHSNCKRNIEPILKRKKFDKFQTDFIMRLK